MEEGIRHSVSTSLSARVGVKMWAEIFLVTFLVLLSHWIYRDECRRPPDFPPGPAWLPIIGNLHLIYQLKKKLGYFFSVLEYLSEKYGPVYGLKLGQDLTVVITDYEIMKTVLTKEEFQGRPHGYVFTMRTFGEKLGIAFGDGPVCASLRNFTLKVLRDIGAGKEAIHQQYIAAEASELVHFLRGLLADNSKMSEEKYNLDTLLKICILNSQWTLIAGKRFHYDDKEFIILLDLVTKFLESMDGTGGIVNHLPWIRFIAPDASGFTGLNNAVKPMQDYLQRIIEEHKLFFDEYAEHNYVDLFLAEIRKHKEPSETFNEKQLLCVLIDLLQAGMIYTSDALRDMLHYLAQRPKLQEELQNEIDQVIGRDAPPTMEHYNRMVLMRAFYMEILRHATIAPIGVARRATKDTTLLQYQIPKDTVLVSVVHQVLMDEKYWKDPKEFRPERFLSADKSEFRPDDRVMMTFGLGRRRSPAEVNVSSTIFLFMTNILKNFTIMPDENQGKLEWIEGYTLSPPPFTGSIRIRD